MQKLWAPNRKRRTLADRLDASKNRSEQVLKYLRVLLADRQATILMGDVFIALPEYLPRPGLLRLLVPEA
jgi:hypothetical protein